MTTTPPVRLLYLTAEEWPTFRADVAVLFGKWLPRFGVTSDLVTIAPATGAGAGVPWGGGRALVRPVAGGQARRRLSTFWHGLRMASKASGADIDAVQVRDMPVLAACVLLLCRWKRLPFFYWMSYPMPEGQIALARERRFSAGLMKFLYPWASGMLGRLLLRRIVLPLSHHVFVQSPQMKDALAAQGVDPERMTPVPMGVDFEAVDFEAVLPAEDRRLSGRRVLVYLGSLDRPRGIEGLFEMLALLRRRHADLTLVLVGDTADEPQRRRLRECAQAAGVHDEVVWTGWLPMTEAWRYLRCAQIGLSPVPRGPLLDVASPTKLLEYFMFGLPVVCNDNPDQAELMAASGAGRCVPYTVEAFASAVEELLALDPGARAAMGQAGRRFVGEARDYRTLAAGLARRYQALRDAR